MLVFGFAGLIFVGTLLLNTPWATKSGEPPGLLTALFTATSAVCVTGLVVVDTGTFWSTFGQAIILALIQFGGLGIMTSAAIFSVLLGRRIGLKERILIRESLNQVNVAGVVRLVRYIFIYTLTVEVFLLSSLPYAWRVTTTGRLISGTAFSMPFLPLITQALIFLVILLTTAILLVIGTLLFLVLEFSHALAPFSVSVKLL
ncbi:potassium transporter TrkG [Ammonifex degensii]|uniref:potassium transporter TrkG n=1 Tax=Ammonifex degensii TaxID=42838 RepID=UPI001B7FBE9E|nr:potassium transporter TrkG [Ammonifex degensii]